MLMHPNSPDELTNGVAVTCDPIYGTHGSYYVNTPLGEDSATNREASSVPEEILLDEHGGITVLCTSNHIPLGQLLLSDSQPAQLRQHLEVIHDHLETPNTPAADEPFTIEIKFKVTSENILAIEQACPWVFGRAAVSPTDQGPAPPPSSPPPAPPLAAWAIEPGRGARTACPGGATRAINPSHPAARH